MKLLFGFFFLFLSSSVFGAVVHVEPLPWHYTTSSIFHCTGGDSLAYIHSCIAVSSPDCPKTAYNVTSTFWSYSDTFAGAGGCGGYTGGSRGCPLGYSVNTVTNTCDGSACPSGQVADASSNCVVPAVCSYPLVASETGGCVACPAGLVGVSGICVLPLVCPAGQETHDGLTCVNEVCSSPLQVFQPGVGCVTKSCGVGTTLNLVTGNCDPIVCPVGKVLSGNDCVDQHCPVGEVLSGNLCLPIQCPVGQVLVNGVCVARTCPTGEAVDGVTGQCVSSQACVNSAYHWDAAKQSCVMNDNPVICQAPQVLNAAGTACVAAPVVCPAGQVPDAAGTACVAAPLSCPAGQVLADGKCVVEPLRCASPMVLNSDGTGCVNPDSPDAPGNQPGGPGNPGGTPLPPSPVVVCAAGQVKDQSGTKCVKAGLVCVAPMVLSADGLGCVDAPLVCGPGMVKDATGLKCVKAPGIQCAAPQVANADGSACVNPGPVVCSGGKVLNAAKTACVDPVPCAAGTVPNASNTACVPIDSAGARFGGGDPVITKPVVVYPDLDAPSWSAVAGSFRSAVAGSPIGQALGRLSFAVPAGSCPVFSGYIPWLQTQFVVDVHCYLWGLLAVVITPISIAVATYKAIMSFIR